MLAGHVGAAMAVARGERRVNVGAFVIASLLLDFALWTLVILGWESAFIGPDFLKTHQARFLFPYSHGLPAAAAWSALAGAAFFLGSSRLKQARLRASALIAAAVFSHWLLDALVHAPELPVAGEGSMKIGLGLWRAMPAALALESLITTAGLYLFVSGSGLPPARKLWLSALSALILAFTVAGMTVAPPPPSATAMAASSLVALAAICALALRFGRLPN